MELRGAPRARDITEQQAETILNEVLDSGINYIDTSIDYGLSEERIGRYISHLLNITWPANVAVWSAHPRHPAANEAHTSSRATTSWPGSNKVLRG
jgi:aryl-alcohol dehydrogenase-like predicted oxidoreductase